MSRLTRAGPIHLCVGAVGALVAAAPAALDQWLSAEECARAAAIATAQRRAQFLAGRWLARRLMVARLGGTPADWPMTAPAAGAPAAVRGGLQVSISHSGDAVACAVGEAALGLDIEAPHRPRDVRGIARLVCTASEQAWLQAVPGDEELARFYEVWTVKEAWLKACGQDLSPHRLACIAITPVPADPAVAAAQARTWQRDSMTLALAAPTGARVEQVAWLGEELPPCRRWQVEDRPDRAGRADALRPPA